MRMCSSGHEEIVFEVNECPGCELVDDIEQKDKEIEKLEDEIAGLNRDIGELEKERDEHKCTQSQTVE